MGKKKAVIIENTAQASTAVMNIGVLWSTIDTINAHYNKKIVETLNEIKKEAAEKIEPSIDSLTEQLNALKVFATKNRDSLTKDGVKTVKVIGGAFGWRKLPPSVSISDMDTVIEALKKLKLGKFIQTKETVNKEAMLKDPETVKEVVGIAINEGGEKFFVIPDGLQEIMLNVVKEILKGLGKTKKRKKA